MPKSSIFSMKRWQGPRRRRPQRKLPQRKLPQRKRLRRARRRTQTPRSRRTPFQDSDPAKETAASIATVALREAVLPEPVPATLRRAPGLAPGAPASPVAAASSVSLETLFAERLRTLEERIARKNADFEALTRAYERNKESERTAVARGAALAAELEAARTVLESEQNRTREIDRSESRSLRDSLAERDAHIAELQTEQAEMTRALEARDQAGAQLEQALAGSAVACRRDCVGVESQPGCRREARCAAREQRLPPECRARRVGGRECAVAVLSRILAHARMAAWIRSKPGPRSGFSTRRCPRGGQCAPDAARTAASRDG